MNIIKYFNSLFTERKVNHVLIYFGLIFLFWMVLFINAVISKDIFWYFFAGAKGLYAFMFFIVYFFFLY